MRAAEAEVKWFRGNTHAHTTRCGHADSEPEVVAKWYLDHGYHFLCLSEHNQFIDPKTVKLPDDRRKDFILVPGEEITGQHVHMTGLNMERIVNHLIKGPNGKVIQAFTDATRELGGTPIINHPNFQWALKTSDIRPARNCYLFELWNAHPGVNSAGNAEHISTEQMWDELLTDGMVMYGVSSDDTHHLKVIDRNKSNPGRGWVMVQAKELTPNAIATAMDRGDFYATSGVMLKTAERGPKGSRIVVDEDATARYADDPMVIGEILPAGSAPTGYQIEFIGPSGKVLAGHTGTDASYSPPADAQLAFFRGRVSFVRTASDGTLRRYRAWTQPVFLDGRVEKLGDSRALPAGN